MIYLFPPKHDLTSFHETHSLSEMSNKNNVQRCTLVTEISAKTSKISSDNRQKSRRELRRFSTKTPDELLLDAKKEEMRINERIRFSRGLAKIKKFGKGFRMSQKQINNVLSHSKLKEKIKSKLHPNDKYKFKRFNTEYFYKRQRSVKVKQICKKTVKDPEEGILTISITDTGCGMSEVDKEQLFKPFSQANKAIHSKFGGTGLGLWLCHKLLTAMKGTIVCTSSLGKGTTFTVSIPMKSKENPNEENNINAQSKSIFSDLSLIFFLKNTEEAILRLTNLGCNTIVCKDKENLLETLRVNPEIIFN